MNKEKLTLSGSKKYLSKLQAFLHILKKKQSNVFVGTNKTIKLKYHLYIM